MVAGMSDDGRQKERPRRSLGGRPPNARHQHERTTRGFWSTTMIPIYAIILLILHLGFHIGIVIGRLHTQLRRLARQRGNFTLDNQEALLETIGSKLRAQIDKVEGDKGIPSLEGLHVPQEQVVEDVSISQDNCFHFPKVKVPRHVAIAFAEREDSVLQIFAKGLAAKLRPETHSWEMQGELRLLHRQAHLVEQTRHAVRWAALAGIDQISIYDDRGLLKEYYQNQSCKVMQQWSTQRSEKRSDGPREAREWTGTQRETSPNRLEALSATSEGSSSQSSSVFDEAGGVARVSSPASSLPSQESESASLNASSKKDDEGQYRAASRTYQINVELCISGQHDVSLESQMARRYAAIKKRNLQASQRIAEEAIPLYITVNILSREDGKDELAQVATSLKELVRAQTEEEMQVDGSHSPHDLAAERTERRKMRKLLLDRIDARKVDLASQERGCMGEPELLIIHGGQRRVLSLAGFPPWPIRLSEIYHCRAVGTHESLKAEDLVNAMLQYSGSTQRYGR